MPSTLDALAASLSRLAAAAVRPIAALVLQTTHPFREMVDPALELLAGVVPEWPLLTEWNRWCLDNRIRFFVWRAQPDGPDDRHRLEALVHTIMMLAGKERGVSLYRSAQVAEVEVVMAGDDCVICDEHRHRVVPLAQGGLEHLPPFHPGCRCGMVPRLE